MPVSCFNKLSLLSAMNTKDHHATTPGYCFQSWTLWTLCNVVILRYIFMYCLSLITSDMTFIIPDTSHTMNRNIY